jgi:hypothetical protein
MRDGLGIDSPRMGPDCSTKVLGKRSVPVELDYYSITPGDWDKSPNGVLFGLWPPAYYNDEDFEFQSVRLEPCRGR